MNLYPHFRILHGSAARSRWVLELSFDAATKSWLVPHGPPSRPHDRHLAIERTVAGEATSLAIHCWDAGPAEIRKWTPRHVVAVLHGARFRGCFALVRLSPAAQAHWLWVRVNPRTHPVLRHANTRRAEGQLA